jgi:acyl-CoA thioester hydrolase
MKDYIYSLEFDVRDYEIDSEGIVNNAVYLHYLEHTRHQFCAKAGYTFEQMEKDGIIPVLNRIEVDYKTPLRSGETIVSKLWIEMQGVRFIFHQDIHIKETGELSIKAVVSIVCVENGKLSRGEKLAEKFSKYL